MRLTQHADRRRRQRCLPLQVLSIICDYGSPRASKGATSYTLDEHSIALAADGDRRRRSQLQRYSGAYVIIEDGHIKTAARRTRRFRR